MGQVRDIPGISFEKRIPQGYPRDILTYPKIPKVIRGVWIPDGVSLAPVGPPWAASGTVTSDRRSKSLGLRPLKLDSVKLEGLNAGDMIPKMCYIIEGLANSGD
jgi:hypothetical protein